MSPIVEGGRLGRYKILRMLGAGAMGEVFLAEDPQIGRRVAIKTVKIEEGRPNEMEERKRRLERESRAAGKLLHPNVVALFDVGEDAGVLYLAFECVEGSDLAQRLEVEPPLSLREAITFVRQAAEGLDYAHRQGVVHRDIKPSNLLISAATGTVKVSDFGIAKLKDQTSDLTMTGSVVGSPHYLSPEQIRGDELDGRSDIFSLGVLFYEVLSRRRPFQGETLTTLVYQILHRDPPSIVVDRPELGTRLEGVLQRMLQKDRDERYKTAGEVARDLAICEQEIPASILDSPAAKDAGAPTDSTRRMSTSERAAEAVTGQSVPPPPRPAASGMPPSFTQAPTEMLAAHPPMPPRPLVGAAAGSAGVAGTGGGSRTGLWVAGGAVALLILALVVGGLAARRWVAAKQAGKAESKVAATTEPAGTKTAEAVPADARPVTDAAASNTGRTAEGGNAGAAGERFVQAPPPEVPKPAPPVELPQTEPRVEPVKPKPAPPAPAPVQETVEPEPEPAAPEVSEPVVDRPGVDPRIDRMMVTGMALSFVVEPPEAIVKIDGRVIGQAGTWNAKKRDGRAYDLPESGDHLVRILHEGRTMTIRVSASPDAPSPTLVSADLRPPSAMGKKRRLGERP